MCLGRLGIYNPMSASLEQYDFSRTFLQNFIDVVLTQNSSLCPEVIHSKNNLFRQLSSIRKNSLSAQLQPTIYLFIYLFITGQTAPAGFAQGTEFVPNF